MVTMTDEMLNDTHKLAPRVAAWLKRVGEPAAANAARAPARDLAPPRHLLELFPRDRDLVRQIWSEALPLARHTPIVIGKDPRPLRVQRGELLQKLAPLYELDP